VADDGSCHAICLASDECNTNCCIELVGVSYGDCGEPGPGNVCL
jgi:hypothetical protein